MYLVFLAIWIAPVFLIAASRRGAGTERALWALVAVFASWVGFLGFKLSTRDDAGGQGLRNG